MCMPSEHPMRPIYFAKGPVFNKGPEGAGVESVGLSYQVVFFWTLEDGACFVGGK